MICSVKQTVTAVTASHALHQRRIPASSPRSPILTPLLSRKPKLTAFSLQKPLHVSSIERFVSLRGRKDSLIKCEAYEADQSQPVESKIELKNTEAPSEVSKRVKIGSYFALWWALNVVFNIYNKKVLNAYPYPWLTSTLSLAAGSLIMLISWATRIAEAPKTDFDFWKSLLPVAVAHTIGHVAATVSMSKVAVSFTHIIKSGEPAFSVLVSRLLLGESFPLSVYLSLIPIIGGCALAAVTELNFNMTGFMGAMISNLAFVFRNIFSKRGMKGKSVSGMNYYACLSILSLLILTPFALAVEGPKLWAAGWQTAISQIGPHFVWWVVAQSVFYHLYNQVSYMSLDEISPLTFSVGNTMKRISVIVSSIIIFRTPVQPVNALGAAIAILGTFLYSQFLKIFALSAIFCFSVACGDTSLRYLPVSFNQAIGAMMPFFTAIFAFIITCKKESAEVYLALMPVVFGIVLASNSEPLFHLFGFLVCIGSTAGRALKLVIQGILLTSEAEKLHSMNLLLYMAPMAVMILLPFTIYIEGNVAAITIEKTRGDPYIVFLLLGNATAAYLVNLTNFLVTKHTSALTLRVLGNAKAVVAAIVSVLIFRNPVMGMAGFAVTVMRVVLYSEAKKRMETAISTH